MTNEHGQRTVPIDKTRAIADAAREYAEVMDHLVEDADDNKRLGHTLETRTDAAVSIALVCCLVGGPIVAGIGATTDVRALTMIGIVALALPIFAGAYGAALELRAWLFGGDVSRSAYSAGRVRVRGLFPWLFGRTPRS